MENEPGQDPNYDNVSFIDEYPELQKRVWLRRLAAQRQLGQSAITHIFQYPNVTEIRRPHPDNPDEPA